MPVLFLLSSPKIGFSPRNVKFGMGSGTWYIFAPKGYIPLSNFHTKFGMGDGFPRTDNRVNFHFCGFINVALWPPKSPKIAIFGINLSLRNNQGVHRET